MQFTLHGTGMGLKGITWMETCCRRHAMKTGKDWLVRVTSIVSLINIAQPFRMAVHLNKGPGQNATDDHDRGQCQRIYAGGG